MRTPQRPPLLSHLIGQTPPQELISLLGGGSGPLVEDTYMHWDDLRRRTPPDGLTVEQWWLAIKLARRDRRVVALRDRAGRPFSFTLPDPLLERLARIDREGSGHVSVPGEIASAATRDRYLQSSLMEEAITSSLLEGATTTREEAREMIRTGRSARSDGERMVMGNYRAMEWIRTQETADLTPALVLELHRVLMDDSRPDIAGRLRNAFRVIRVENHQTGEVLHVPPEASELPDRLERMCVFANDPGAAGIFVHPAVRAILLHFWLAYDHPFEDGNGRTARSLFYWAMMKQGYWLFEFVSISALLRKAPAQYARSFLLTETDDLDLTYFLLAQADVMTRALDALNDYLVRKRAELHQTMRAIRTAVELNHRQTSLITHALQHATHTYTVESHQRSHRVTNPTARTDLLGLEALGLLLRRKVGKRFVFTPAPDLAGRLRTLE